MPILKIFKNLERREHSDSFYEVNLTLIPKSDRDTPATKLQANFPVKHTCKTLHKTHTFKKKFKNCTLTGSCTTVKWNLFLRGKGGLT